MAELPQRRRAARGPAAPRQSPRAAADSTSVSPARQTAFDLLQRIGASSLHSDDALHGPALAPLQEADRKLTTALVLGVLRWQIALDARLRPLLSRPEMALPEPVLLALRLGAFQLLHLDRIPAHAAVHESVELVRAAGHAHAAGMVNAVLRKVAGSPPPRRPLVESLAAMAERLGHPQWLAERWAEQYGRLAAEQICAFHQEEPPCAALFADEGSEAPSPVMDAGSRLVAELAAIAAAGARRVWDCCAAPGGKTLVLARRLPKAELLATDASPVRLRRLADRLRREAPGHAVELLETHAEALPAEKGLFDLVLCDVPCSGTGTLARNPEIRHRLRVADLPRQKERQSRILRAALQRLTPGGRLVYSTCSLEREECGEVVDEVLSSAGNGFTQLSAVPLIEQLRAEGRLVSGETESQAWVRQGCLRTLPGVGFAGDGFFAAVLERRKGSDAPPLSAG